MKRMDPVQRSIGSRRDTRTGGPGRSKPARNGRPTASSPKPIKFAPAMIGLNASSSLDRLLTSPLWRYSRNAEARPLRWSRSWKTRIA